MTGDGVVAIASATMRIGGDGAFGRLAGEDGVHRFVRQAPCGRPVANVRVEVLAGDGYPDAIRVDDGELRVETFREVRGCGMPRPEWDRSVRLTHRPTGITVSCAGRGSRRRNEDGAMTVLRARLLDRRRGRHSPATPGEPVRTYVDDGARVRIDPPAPRCGSSAVMSGEDVARWAW